MLHLLLAAVVLGCVTVAQYSPDSHLRGILFEPSKSTRHSRILNNHQRPPIHDFLNRGGSAPSQGYQPSSRDPFTPDSGVHPSSDPFSSDDGTGRHHPHNNPGHSGEPRFGSGNINNNRYPQHHSPPYQRRLVHPQQKELHHEEPFGTFGNGPISKKSSNDDSFDLLSPIAPIQGLSDPIDGSTSKHVPHKQRDPFAVQNRQPSHNQFGNDGNQQHPVRNNNNYHPAHGYAGFQPTPPYARNEPHQAPTYTPSQSAQYPTDNHDNSRPNPPTPSIPTFGQPLAPPTEFVPTHRHNRNNGPPNHNDEEYQRPRNSPSSPRSYQPNHNQRPYPERDTIHGQQTPSYVQNPHRDDNPHSQGQNYADPSQHRNPHQDQQYPDTGPHQSNQYESPNSHQGPDSRNNQYSVNRPAGDRQYPDPRSSEGHQYPSPGQHPVYIGSNSHQYPAPSPQNDKQYPDNNNNQSPQYSGSRPDQDQPHSNPNQGNTYPSSNEQPYQQNQDSKPSYPVAPHGQVHEDPRYVPSQGTQAPHSAPHTDREYPGVESQPSRHYGDPHPDQHSFDHADEHYNPAKTSPAEHTAPDSYPQQHVSRDSPSAVHTDPQPDLEYNKNTNGDQTDRYPGNDHTDHALSSTPTEPSYPPPTDAGVHVKEADYEGDEGNTPKGNAYPDTASGSYPQDENKYSGNNENSPQYSDKASHAGRSYPDKSSQPLNGAHSYPDSNTAQPDTIQHPTSYPDKGTHKADNEYPGSYPSKSSHPDSGTHDYQDSYPDNIGTAEHPAKYPDKTTIRTADEHPGGHQAAADHPGKNAIDYPVAYPIKSNPGTVDHPTSYPDKATHNAAAERSGSDVHDHQGSYPGNTNPGVVDHPTSYPDTTGHDTVDEHPGSYPSKSSHPGTDTYPDKVEHPTSYPDKNTHQAAAEHPGSYPVTSDHAVPETHPTSYPAKTTNPGTNKQSGSYLPISTNHDNTVHSTSYPDKSLTHDTDTLVHPDSHLNNPHSEHPGSYTDTTHSNSADRDGSYPDKSTLPGKAEHDDTYAPNPTNPRSHSHTPKPNNPRPDSYPPKRTTPHSDSYPPEGTNQQLDSYPPKGTNPSASASYPGIQSSSEHVHPKPHINPHKIHSKFPRNRYPEGARVIPSYPPISPRPNNAIKQNNVVEIPEYHPTVHPDPVSHGETRESPRREEVKPSTPFIPPGLQGQCFRYSDPSAGYKLSDNTFGYPEDEIAAEIRARPFLAPILGYKNFAQSTNQFDVNQLGLSGYERHTPLNNNYLYSRKDYPSEYKDGDFEKPTPRDFSCRMTTKPLRMFKLYGGRCWAVNPDFKKVTYKKCGAPGDYCSGHRGRCSEDHDWVEVWSHCEKAPRGQRTKPRKLYLPVGCSCKSYYC